MRWATVKLGIIVVGAVAVSLALSLLMGWWHGPMDQLQGQFNPNSFDFEGIVPVAYTVYAVALGLAVGTMLRHTIPAMAVTLIGFLGLRGLLEVVRVHYLPPVVQTVAGGYPPLGRSDWVLDQGLQDRGRHIVRYLDAVRLCGLTHGEGLDATCLRHHGIVHVIGHLFWVSGTSGDAERAEKPVAQAHLVALVTRISKYNATEETSGNAREKGRLPQGPLREIHRSRRTEKRRVRRTLSDRYSERTPTFPHRRNSGVDTGGAGWSVIERSPPRAFHPRRGVASSPEERVP